MHQTPRWVKVFLLVALLILATLLVVGILLGEGHGPARHLGSRGHETPERSTEAAGGPREPAWRFDDDPPGLACHEAGRCDAGTRGQAAVQ